MKIVLTSVGTRGDMEPFLAIGEILKDHGHDVICAFPEQFRDLAEESQLKFSSLGSKFIDLLDSKAGKAALGGDTGWKKIVGTLRLALNQSDANKELLLNQQKIIDGVKPDRIVYNGKAVFPVLWRLRNGGKTIFISPLPYMHYVKDHTHIAFNSNFGSFFNKLTFSLAHFGMVTTLRICEKWLKYTEKTSRKKIKQNLRFNNSIYTISPTLFSRPDYWNKNIQVLGYHERRKDVKWSPDDSLAEFLKNHDKILFITFGSMINAAPEDKTRIILDILERSGIPAIINTASGGLVKPETFDSKLVYFSSQVPYDWIFPRVYGVIHHGGSGTTHLALKYGCATMIIPHIIDQFVWNKIVSNLGAGPKGPKINKINQKNLELKILELVNNSEFKKKAEQIGKQMQNENYREELYNFIVK